MYMYRHSFVSKFLIEVSIVVILIFYLDFPASQCPLGENSSKNEIVYKQHHNSFI